MITRFLNINSLFEAKLLHPRARNELSTDALCEIFTPSIAELEMARDREIDIPERLVDIYSRYRPTPLFRATGLERAIGTDCEIFIKDESTTPTGNHKLNSAYLLVYLCKRDGIKKIVTETTGNWGIALAMAAKEFGLEAICFLDEPSHRKRPDRKKTMEALGAKVTVVKEDSNEHCLDYLKLCATEAIKYMQHEARSTYMFGSIYAYFIIPQSLIGLEAMEQMEALGKFPDIILGCCGGGANFLGLAAPFLAASLDDGRKVQIIAAEAEGFPILSRGRKGYYSIDDLQYYPLLYTYGLEEFTGSTYVGGLGSTIVASAAAHFHSREMIQTTTLTEYEALEAAKLFHRAEARWIALESSYAMAAAIQVAKRATRKRILLNVSSGETDAHFYDRESSQ